jgi:hypothetical protein
MVPPFFITMVHIGKLIDRQERSITWFAKRLYCDRSNVYAIFKRQSIDTEQLLRISIILKYNFFKPYFQEYSDCEKKSTIV